jgi:transposase-like protein
VSASAEQQAEIRAMVNEGKRTEAEAARLFGVHRSTISRLRRQQGKG